MSSCPWISSRSGRPGRGSCGSIIRLGALLWTGLRALGGLLRWYSGFKAAGAGEGQEKPEGNTSRARAA